MYTTLKFHQACAELSRTGAPRLVPLGAGVALFLITLIAVAAEQEADLASPDWL